MTGSGHCHWIECAAAMDALLARQPIVIDIHCKQAEINNNRKAECYRWCSLNVGGLLLPPNCLDAALEEYWSKYSTGTRAQTAALTKSTLKRMRGHSMLIYGDGEACQELAARLEADNVALLRNAQLELPFGKRQFLRAIRTSNVPTLPEFGQHITNSARDQRLTSRAEDVLFQENHGCGGEGTLVATAENARSMLQEEAFRTDVARPVVPACCISHHISASAWTGEPNNVVVMDQHVDGFTFAGASWPSRAPTSVIRDVIRITEHVGSVLRTLNFAGAFGIDLLDIRNVGLRVVDVNPRPTATQFAWWAARQNRPGDLLSSFAMSKTVPGQTWASSPAGPLPERAHASHRSLPVFAYPDQFEFAVKLSYQHERVLP